MTPEINLTPPDTLAEIEAVIGEPVPVPGRSYRVWEYCGGGELFTFRGLIGEVNAARIDAAKAAADAHYREVMERGLVRAEI